MTNTDLGLDLLLLVLDPFNDIDRIPYHLKAFYSNGNLAFTFYQPGLQMVMKHLTLGYCHLC